jgi:hypothetical protein|tara:strand:- start:291 stop:1043 length:753 start_codon:yes stop_codon:yes gene_type:complete
MLSAEEVDWISSEDFKEMKSLGIDNPKEYFKQKENKVTDKNVESILLESVEHVTVNETSLPTLIVIDNFFNDPDSVRDFAMTRDYVPRGEHGAVGNRTLIHHHFKGVRTHFEKLLGSNIVDGTEIGGWDYQPNGAFQHCMAEDPFVIHADSQQWAAMVYLTPDAPLKSGTSMYVHKETGIDAIRNQEWNIFKGNFYDDTPFEVVDKIGNKYNRCVLMDARLIHAASRYFGDAITNDRLFQIYFFNTEEQK